MRGRPFQSLLWIGIWLTGLLIPFLIGQDEANAASSLSAFKGWSVSSFELQGVPAHLAGQLLDGLVLSGEKTLIWTRRPRFFPVTLEEDLQRTKLFLARRGYPYSTVREKIYPVTTDKEIAIVFVVDSGPVVVVDRIDFVGLSETLISSADSVVSLNEGMEFSEELIRRGARELRTWLQHVGYAEAIVRYEISREDSFHVAVAFQMTTGPLCTFNRVVVHGTSPDLVYLSKKTAGIKHGTVYNPEIIRRAQGNLRMLQLFRQIRVTLEGVSSSNPTVEPGGIDVVLDLIERDHRTLSFDVGYWTDDGFRLHSAWRHRNLFKEGRGVSIDGKYSRFEQSLTGSVWRPALWRSRTLGMADMSISNETEESFTARSYGLKLSASQQYSYRTKLRVAWAISKVDLEVDADAQESFKEPGGRLSYLSLFWTRSTSDDRLFPTSGLTTTFMVEHTVPALSETEYARSEAVAVWYAKLPLGIVLATRIDVGMGWPLGSPDLLPNKRFFSGGASAMRGFKRRKLGPLDDNGAPLGGEAKVEGALELRFPIVGRVGGAAFFDVGQAWARRNDIRLEDLEVAIGPGLIVNTPVGPARADLGYRLTSHDDSQPKSVVHFSIGHPF